MGVVAKQSIWNTVIIYIGIVIGYLNVTIFFPRVIGADGYGLTRVLLSIVFIAQNFALLGTPSMIMRYFPRFKEVNGRGLLSFAFLVFVIGLVIVITLLISFKEPIIEMKREQSPLLDDFYFLVLPILLFNASFLFLSNVCRVNLNTVLPIFVNDFFYKTLTTILLGLTWWFDWSLDFFLILWALAYMLNAMILLVWLISKKLLQFGKDERIDKAFKKESLDFSLFSMLAGTSTSVVSNVDVLMVGLLLVSNSLEMAGIYAIMVYLGSAVLMPTRGLGTIASPLASEYTEKNEMDKLADLYERTSRNQLIAVGFLFTGIFVNLPSLLEIMEIDYAIGMPVFALIGMARLVQSSTGINGVILVYSKFYRYSTYFIAGLAVVSIVSNYLLIPKYQLTGAAFASFVSLLGFEFLKWLFVWIKLKLQPFNRKHALIIVIGLVILAIGYYLPRLSNIWLDMFYRSVSISILAFASLMFLDLSSDIKALIFKGLAYVGIHRE